MINKNAFTCETALSTSVIHEDVSRSAALVEKATEA